MSEKAKASKQQAKKSTAVPKTPRTGTKKYATFEVWKSGGTLEQALAAALKFVGKSDAGVEKSTKGSVYAWFREFDRRFGTAR